MKREFKKVSFGAAIIVFLVVAAIMAVGLAIVKLNTMVTFLLALIAVCIMAVILGMDLNTLQDTILAGLNKCSLVIMIMIAVGMVVGSWMMSGIVPSIIYYGLSIFTPASFLALGFVICCIVSFFTGSAYAALGTMGVAFMAIGYGMGINPALVAGMSVSGAIFGDKMSPFSDTTNMAPAAVLREDAIRGNTMGAQYDPLDPPAEGVKLYGNLVLGANYIRTAFSLPIYVSALNA